MADMASSVHARALEEIGIRSFNTLAASVIDSEGSELRVDMIKVWPSVTKSYKTYVSVIAVST